MTIPLHLGPVVLDSPLLQAALAGFLFQHGSQDRAVARHYLNGLFRRDPATVQPG